MSRKLGVAFSTVLALGLLLGAGISCSEYFFAAYPDIEVQVCPLNACPASVDPSVPPGEAEPTTAFFSDPGLTTGAPKMEKLTMRIYNAGEGELAVKAPSIHDFSPGDSICVFGMESPTGNDYEPGEVCPKGSTTCSCDSSEIAVDGDGNCDPNRAETAVAWLHLLSGGYAEYTLTYYYTEMHTGCERTLALQNSDPDTEQLVGAEENENPWTVILKGSQACDIDITPTSYEFGSGVTGATKGTTLEMRLENCDEVRLVGMRIVDAAGADPVAEQRGALGSLCVGPNEATGEPEPQSNTCATDNCLEGGAKVARCVDTCENDADCGNSIKCQEDAGGNKICWPLSPWENAGRGGGSDIAVMHYGTREDRDGQPSFPKTLRSHADNDPDGWITTTFTCTDQPTAGRDARVEVLYDLNDGRPRAAYGSLSGTCGTCPQAIIQVTDPPLGEIKPLDTVVLDGSGSSSTSGMTIRYKWYFSQAPADSHTGYRPEGNPGAANTLESISTNSQPTFFVDLAGVYKPCLEICELKTDGSVNACTSDDECQNDACVEIDATPREAVHIQLVWDHPETDVDLHYIRSGSTYGDRNTANPGGDCHFFNPHPDYCVANDDSDDPSLDIDDVRGYGPENINHNEPCDDEYRIWASYYEDKGMGSTRAKVRVFIKGVMASETSHVLDRRNCHWLVGKVIWSGDNGTFEQATDNNYVCGANNPEE